jgi:hypothetical protein
MAAFNKYITINNVMSIEIAEPAMPYIGINM